LWTLPLADRDVLVERRDVVDRVIVLLLLGMSSSVKDRRRDRLLRPPGADDEEEDKVLTPYASAFPEVCPPFIIDGARGAWIIFNGLASLCRIENINSVQQFGSV